MSTNHTQKTVDTSVPLQKDQESMEKKVSAHLLMVVGMPFEPEDWLQISSIVIVDVLI